MACASTANSTSYSTLPGRTRTLTATYSATIIRQAFRPRENEGSGSNYTHSVIPSSTLQSTKPRTLTGYGCTQRIVLQGGAD